MSQMGKSPWLSVSQESDIPDLMLIYNLSTRKLMNLDYWNMEMDQ